MAELPEEPLPPVPVREGDVLAGKFRVERVLGVGGMGVVVAATHMQLEQRVALKFVLPTGMQSAEAIERFSREARAAVRLRSEHVARVLDVGTLETGAPYIVMEFLEGRDLATVLTQSGPLSPSDAVDFVLQACEALAEAHALGIVHRDLKPRNLFLARRVDGRPLVKVLDFGISKVPGTSASAASSLSLTRTSAMMGSPNYMSPEQLRSSRDVDFRSDLWSLGVILYELTTGRVPFEAESVTQLCAMVLEDTPRAPHELRPGIPSGLSAVVLRCLAKAPADRFRSIAELAQALEPFAAQGAGAAARLHHVGRAPGDRAKDSDESLPAPAAVTGDPSRSWGSSAKGRASRRTVWLALPVAAVALASVSMWAMRPAHRTPGADASMQSATVEAGPPPLATSAVARAAEAAPTRSVERPDERPALASPLAAPSGLEADAAPAPPPSSSPARRPSGPLRERPPPSRPGDDMPSERY